MLFVVEGLVAGAENLFNGFAVAGILGNPDADGETRDFDIFGETLGDSAGNPAGVFGGRPGQNQSELIAAITSGCIDRTATQAENLRHAAESEAAHDVPGHIVDLLYAVEVEQDHRKRSAVARVTLDFRTEAIDQQSVVGEAGERVADGQCASVFLLTAAFRNFRAEDESHQGHDTKERLQEKKRIVWSLAEEGPPAMHRSNNCDYRKQAKSS